VARTAVASVFCALITMIGIPGRLSSSPGMASSPLASGRITSVMTTSPCPSSTSFHSPAMLSVVRTL
jgi:hypothetical protein